MSSTANEQTLAALGRLALAVVRHGTRRGLARAAADCLSQQLPLVALELVWVGRPGTHDLVRAKPQPAGMPKVDLATRPRSGSVVPETIGKGVPVLYRVSAASSFAERSHAEAMGASWVLAFGVTHAPNPEVACVFYLRGADSARPRIDEGLLAATATLLAAGVAQVGRVERVAARCREAHLALVADRANAGAPAVALTSLLTPPPVPVALVPVKPVTFKKGAAEVIARALRATRGKIYGEDGAAAVLGLKPSTLQSKMLKLGVRREKYM
ncbi:MAG: hypothetical protein ACI9MR_004258 [Myxococcota bacterium]|jgi:hypothetical protein